MEKLTFQEEEAMRFIWNLGPCFVKDVVGCYAEPKPPYTTVASIINNLKRKGYLQAERFGNTYRYTPLVAQEEYTSKSVGNIVRNYILLWWLRKNIPASLWATLCAIILPILIRRWFRSLPRNRRFPRKT